MTTVNVSFPEGRKIVAEIDGMLIPTDQPVSSGGQGSAPGPFDLFLASIATCASYYALEFCTSRDLDTTGLALSMNGEKNQELKRFTKFDIDLTLPNNFPQKYEKTILKAMEHCSVKKHLLNPPDFDIKVVNSSHD